jgi:hypothetical protein
MFVLMIGLLGVAAMIPAGRHEILEGSKIDNATAVGRAAFRDLKIRGYLNPANWRDSGGATGVFSPPDNVTYFTYWFPTSNTNTQGGGGPDVTPAVAIDPLGITAPSTPPFGNFFPYGAGANLYLTRIFPDNRSSATLAQLTLLSDLVFRASDDLLFTPNTDGQDNPPEQTVYSGTVMQPYSKGGTPLKRASEGNYSWLATLVTDPSASALYSNLTVSVAVFYKRDLSNPALTERIGNIATGVAGFPGFGIGGGEIRFQHPATPSPPVALKPGQWVMLAGRITSGTTYDYYRWYRVVAADVLTNNANPPVVDPNKANNTWQYVTLAGQDWNDATTDTQIWIFDNVVTVYEKSMRLEIE